MNLSREKRNVLILAAAQALFQCTIIITMALGGLIGHRLLEDKSLATLPVTTMMLGAALVTVPASLLMGRFGRRAGFFWGAVIGAIGGGVGLLGIVREDFGLFVLGTALTGIHQGFAQYYRFAAADAANEAFRSRAIAYVLAGGVVAAIAAPELTKLTRDLLAPHTFAGAYVAVLALNAGVALLMGLLDIPAPTERELHAAARPLGTIARQPAFMVAVLSAMVGPGVMTLTMAATPLAMVAHHHAVEDSALVIQWHVLGMFVPSFFTGALIARFGLLNIMLAGTLLLAGHVSIALSGVEMLHFLSALTLLGVGWNFLYVGATTLLTETYTPAERAKTQAVNDFLMSASVVVASFFSGSLLHHFGWQGVNLGAIPFLLAVGAATVALMIARRAARQAA